jgi:hypothetical protein
MMFLTFLAVLTCVTGAIATLLLALAVGLSPRALR